MLGKPKSLEELFRSDFSLIVPGGYSSDRVAAGMFVEAEKSYFKSHLAAVSGESIYDDIRTVLASYAASCAYGQLVSGASFGYPICCHFYSSAPRRLQRRGNASSSHGLGP